jgi:predicted transcriptional regulator
VDAAMSFGNSNDPTNYLEQATEIVAAFVSHNSIPASELPALIQAVYSALVGLGSGSAAPDVEIRSEPAVPIKKSVTPDFIFCLEDGKKFQSLKRHLRTAYSLTPEEYRVKWGLPSDYPMVAPNYAQRRSQLARNSGLGTVRSTKGKSSKKEGLAAV